MDLKIVFNLLYGPVFVILVQHGILVGNVGILWSSQVSCRHINKYIDGRKIANFCLSANTLSMGSIMIYVPEEK